MLMHNILFCFFIINKNKTKTSSHLFFVKNIDWLTFHRCVTFVTVFMRSNSHHIKFKNVKL